MKQLIKRGLRKCYTCHKIKKLKEFYPDSTRPCGIGYRCEPCGKKLYYAWGLKKNKIDAEKRKLAKIKKEDPLKWWRKDVGNW